MQPYKRQYYLPPVLRRLSVSTNEAENSMARCWQLHRRARKLCSQTTADQELGLLCRLVLSYYPHETGTHGRPAGYQWNESHGWACRYPLLPTLRTLPGGIPKCQLPYANMHRVSLYPTQTSIRIGMLHLPQQSPFGYLLRMRMPFLQSVPRCRGCWSGRSLLLLHRSIRC